MDEVLRFVGRIVDPSQRRGFRGEVVVRHRQIARSGGNVPDFERNDFGRRGLAVGVHAGNGESVSLAENEVFNRAFDDVLSVGFNLENRLVGVVIRNFVIAGAGVIIPAQSRGRIFGRVDGREQTDRRVGNVPDGKRYDVGGLGFAVSVDGDDVGAVSRVEIEDSGRVVPIVVDRLGLDDLAAGVEDGNDERSPFRITVVPENVRGRFRRGVEDVLDERRVVNVPDGKFFFRVNFGTTVFVVRVNLADVGRPQVERLLGVFAFADRRRNFERREFAFAAVDLVAFVNDLAVSVDDRDVIRGRVFDGVPNDGRGRLRRGVNFDVHRARRHGRRPDDVDLGGFRNGVSGAVGDDAVNVGRANFELPARPFGRVGRERRDGFPTVVGRNDDAVTGFVVGVILPGQLNDRRRLIGLNDGQIGRRGRGFRFVSAEVDESALNAAVSGQVGQGFDVIVVAFVDGLRTDGEGIVAFRRVVEERFRRVEGVIDDAVVGFVRPVGEGRKGVVGLRDAVLARVRRGFVENNIACDDRVVENRFGIKSDAQVARGGRAVRGCDVSGDRRVVERRGRVEAEGNAARKIRVGRRIARNFAVDERRVRAALEPNAGRSVETGNFDVFEANGGANVDVNADFVLAGNVQTDEGRRVGNRDGVIAFAVADERNAVRGVRKRSVDRNVFVNFERRIQSDFAAQIGRERNRIAGGSRGDRFAERRNAVGCVDDVLERRNDRRRRFRRVVFVGAEVDRETVEARAPGQVFVAFADERRIALVDRLRIGRERIVAVRRVVEERFVRQVNVSLFGFRPLGKSGQRVIGASKRQGVDVNVGVKGVGVASDLFVFARRVADDNRVVKFRVSAVRRVDAAAVLGGVSDDRNVFEGRFGVADHAQAGRTNERAAPFALRLVLDERRVDGGKVDGVADVKGAAVLGRVIAREHNASERRRRAVGVVDQIAVAQIEETVVLAAFDVKGAAVFPAVVVKLDVRQLYGGVEIANGDRAAVPHRYVAEERRVFEGRGRGNQVAGVENCVAMVAVNADGAAVGVRRVVLEIGVFEGRRRAFELDGAAAVEFVVARRVVLEKIDVDERRRRTGSEINGAPGDREIIRKFNVVEIDRSVGSDVNGAAFFRIVAAAAARQNQVRQNNRRGGGTRVDVKDLNAVGVEGRVAAAVDRDPRGGSAAAAVDRNRFVDNESAERDVDVKRLAAERIGEHDFVSVLRRGDRFAEGEKLVGFVDDVFDRRNDKRFDAGREGKRRVVGKPVVVESGDAELVLGFVGEFRRRPKVRFGDKDVFDFRPRAVDVLFDGETGNVGNVFGARPRQGEDRLRRVGKLRFQVGRSVRESADGERFGRRRFGNAVGVDDRDFDVVFAVEIDVDRMRRFRNEFGRARDEGRFAGLGVDGFYVNRNVVAGRGFGAGFGRGVPLQRRGRVCGFIDGRGQTGRLGGNVRRRELNRVAIGGARVVADFDAVGVSRAEFEFAGRPGRRADGEHVGNVLPDLVVLVKRLDRVTDFAVDVVPSQRNGLDARDERFDGQFRNVDDRRRRNRERREREGDPIGRAEIVDGANLEFVRGSEGEGRFVGRFAGAERLVDGRPSRFVVGRVDVGRVAEFVAGFARDVAPRERRGAARRFGSVRFEVGRRGGRDFRRCDRQLVFGEGSNVDVVVNAEVIIARGATGERNFFDAVGRRGRRRELGAGRVVKIEREARGVAVFVSDLNEIIVAADVGRREFEVVGVVRRPGFQTGKRRGTDDAEVGRGGEVVVFFVIVVGFRFRRIDRQGVRGGAGRVGLVVNLNGVFAGRDSFEGNLFGAVDDVYGMRHVAAGRRFQPDVEIGDGNVLRSFQTDVIFGGSVLRKDDAVPVLFASGSGERFDRRFGGKRSELGGAGLVVVAGFAFVLIFGFARRVRGDENREVDDRRFVGLRRGDFGARGGRFKRVERRNAQKSAIFQGFKTQVARSVLFFREGFAQRGSVTGSVEKFHGAGSEWVLGERAIRPVRIAA